MPGPRRRGGGRIDLLIGAFFALFLLALLALVLHLAVLRPLYLSVRRVWWAVSGAVERDDPPAPVADEHPRFVARWVPTPVAGGPRPTARFALGGGGRVLVAPVDEATLGRWDPASPGRNDRLPIRWIACGLAPAVSPDGLLLAELAGRNCHLVRIHPLSGAPEETFDVPVRQLSPAVAAWLADGGDERRECEDEVAAFGLAATTPGGARPLVVVSELQSFVGTRRDGDFGPAAVLVRTYDAGAPTAPPLADTVHPLPPREGPHGSETVLSPDTRLVAVGLMDATADDGVEVLEGTTGRVVCRLDDAPGGPLAFSADSGLLVSALRWSESAGGLIRPRCTVSVWDVPTGRLRSRWVEPRSGVSCAAVTDGPAGLVAVGADSGEDVRHHSWRGTTTVTRHRSSVALHRTDDGTLLDDLPVRPRQIAFAAGNRLVVSGPDGISLWDVAIG